MRSHFPAQAPPSLEALALECLSFEYDNRPYGEDIQGVGSTPLLNVNVIMFNCIAVSL